MVEVRLACYRRRLLTEFKLTPPAWPEHLYLEGLLCLHQ
jgi:hypothetical protein